MQTDLRPRGRGSRQFRPSRARQRSDTRPADRWAVLCGRAGAHPRSLSQCRRQQHVDQCRTQPVPSADRQPAGAARPYRHRDGGTRGAVGAACGRAQEARRHALRFRRAQRLRGGDLSLGQSHPLLRARRRRASAASRSVSRMSSSTCRWNRQGDRQFLSHHHRHACRGGERRRHGRARHRRQGSVSAVPRDRPAAAGLSTSTTCRSMSWIFPDRTAA